VFVSAKTRAGIAELRRRIADVLPTPDVLVDVLVPYSKGELVSRVYGEGEVLTQEHTAEGTQLKARVRPDLAGVLERFGHNGSPA
jgi:GTPase